VLGSVGVESRGEPRRAPVVELDSLGFQLGGEAAHGGEDQVGTLAVNQAGVDAATAKEILGEAPADCCNPTAAAWGDPKQG